MVVTEKRFLQTQEKGKGVRGGKWEVPCLRLTIDVIDLSIHRYGTIFLWFSSINFLRLTLSPVTPWRLRGMLHDHPVETMMFPVFWNLVLHR